jgi:predicted dehydrogenase
MKPSISNTSLDQSMTLSPNYRSNNSRTKLKLGLVGAGSIAQIYSQALQACGRATLVGVADICANASQSLAEASKCKSFESNEAMSSHCELDAVIVCTPPNTHEAICIHFLERGIHVLCEKPLSTDVESARRMLTAAEDAGVILTMASKFRYVDDVVRARSLVTSGMLGEIILFENSFTSHVDMSSRWKSVRSISGGGVLIDNGTHSIDVTRYFLGPLAEIEVVEGKRTQGLGVEETVRVFVRSVSGIMAIIDLSWSINKERDSYIDIYGSKGTIQVGWKESKYRERSSREWVVFGTGYNKLQAFSSQIENFCAAICKEVSLVVTPGDALASVQAIDAGYAALRKQCWTPISAECPQLCSDRTVVIEEAGRAA